MDTQLSNDLFTSTGPDPTVQVFASNGFRRSNDGDWTLQITGRITKPFPLNLRRQIVLGLLRQALKVDLHEVRTPLFQDRVRDFLRKTIAGQQITVHLGDSYFVLPTKSKRGGLFSGQIHLTAEELRNVVSRVGEAEQGRWLHFDVKSEPYPNAISLGRVQMIHPMGLSVITDIDDTIKESQVGLRQELLRNTFLRPFKAVPGMQSLYQSWWQQGAAFHYISSSPWQLYRSLSSFLQEAGFPDGSYHLRPLRLRDPAGLTVIGGRKRSKKKAIRGLLRNYAYRRFLLVGDSGERDPEIYGSMARKCPGQIAGIFIRMMPGQLVASSRIRRAFREIPPELWRFFHDPEELADVRMPELASPFPQRCEGF
jgi:phosphatidate phosphatase APP1